uniref:Uncharacterized protein n=1 Tax=Trichuris muris TaxID=70415 RepID=A0A5S6R243_TRIMR
MCPPKGIRMPCEKMRAVFRSEVSQEVCDQSTDDGPSLVYTLLQCLVTILINMYCSKPSTPFQFEKHYFVDDIFDQDAILGELASAQYLYNDKESTTSE